MASIKIELGYLDELRKKLATYLSRMGVTATTDETLKQLVPKVLMISQGNPFTSYFNGEFTKAVVNDGKYSTYLYDTELTLENVIDIIGYFRMTSCTLTLTGRNLNNLNIQADGWTVTTNAGGTQTTISRTTDGINSGGLITTMLTDIIFSATKPNITDDEMPDIHAELAFSAVEEVSGETKTATLYNNKATYFTISHNSWERIEDTYNTWADVENNNLTWTQFENLTPIS